MVKTKKFVTVQLPEELMKEVDNTIAHMSYGYRSRAELIKEGTRRLLLELWKYEKSK